MKGIYCIRNIINDKRYIGSSLFLAIRKNRHLWDLKHEQHHNPHLDRAVQKYGYDNFVFEILDELIDNENLEQCEQDWIDNYRIEGIELYNIRLYVQSNRGIILTQEHKNKIGVANKGRILKPLSEETKQKIRSRKLGKQLSPEHVAATTRAKCKPIKQIDPLTNKIIKIWPSMKEACQTLNICKGGISDVCRGRIKTSGGFKWEYINV